LPAPEIDYYFAPMSGYAYLGHARLLKIAASAGCSIRYHPLDMAKVFAAAGALPPAKYPEVRQHHRKADMLRWAAMFDLPIKPTPAFWPAPMALACAAIVAAKELGKDQGAVAGAILAAVWEKDLNIGDPMDLAEAMTGLGGAEILAAATAPATQTASAAVTEAAIAKGIFGSPTYVVGSEWFFGQDRLDFLEQHVSP